MNSSHAPSSSPLTTSLTTLPFMELESFRAIAQAGSFTKAARLLGLSQSALSHRLRRLEGRLKLRLLHRTTRSLTLTAEGTRLLAVLEQAFGSVSTVLNELQEEHAHVTGTLRLTAALDVAQHLLWPKLAPLLRAYPDLNIEIVNDRALTNIAAQGLDAGVRLGERLEKDMVSVPVSGPQRMVVVAAPDYFKAGSLPQRPEDLPVRECLGLRFSSGSLYHWEFERAGEKVELIPDGQFISNDNELLLEAVKTKQGIGCLLEMHVAPLLGTGQLMTVLEDWCPPFEGFHLYYPSRRHHSKAFTLLLKALRYRE